MYFASMPAMGILSATQKDFLVSELINGLAANAKRSCAILFMPNRAQDEKKERDESKKGIKRELDEDADGAAGGGGDDDEEEEESADVREVVNFFIKAFTGHRTGLQAKVINIIFKEDSIYGKRAGYHTGLMIVPTCPENPFTKSALWKRGVVHDVEMLARKDSRRPNPLDGDSALLLNSVRAGITPVQAQKQARVFAHV
jgi:hypothetical protein